MKNTDLTNTYRELDRELAILHDQLESHRSFENILFLPTPEKIRSVREKWNDLKTQVENLDAPDNVYRLVKHHLNDFLDSLKFTIEEKEHNPFDEMPFNFKYNAPPLDLLKSYSSQEKQTLYSCAY